MALLSRPVLASGPPFRLLPRLSDDNRFFWTSGADGRLRFQRCSSCSMLVHPPGPVCPRCLGDNLAPHAVSGRATVTSYTVNVQQWVPGAAPYAVGVVEIEEQPDVRLTTNLVDVDEDDLAVGMPVEVVFEPADDVFLPLFRPARSDGR